MSLGIFENFGTLLDLEHYSMFGILFCKMCRPIFFTISQNSEINLLEIGPYIDYLTEKQGVRNIFGKFTSGFFC